VEGCSGHPVEMDFLEPEPDHKIHRLAAYEWTPRMGVVYALPPVTLIQDGIRPCEWTPHQPIVPKREAWLLRKERWGGP
jgi:hypothetical protein